MISIKLLPQKKKKIFIWPPGVSLICTLGGVSPPSPWSVYYSLVPRGFCTALFSEHSSPTSQENSFPFHISFSRKPPHTPRLDQEPLISPCIAPPLPFLSSKCQVCDLLSHVCLPH